MATFFHWTPLEPPRHFPQRAMDGTAAMGALIGGLVGIALVLVGQGQSFVASFPLILSVLVLGLPHGAIDHLVVLGLAKRRMTFANLIGVCLIYLIVVVAFLMLWQGAPVIALFIFLAATVYHWGKSDLAFERATRPGSRACAGRAFLDWAHALFRGAIPIGLPFVAFPEPATAFADSLAGAFGGEFAPNAIMPVSVVLGLTLLAAGECVYVVACRRLVTFFETVFLLCFFALVPPLLAIGLYFCTWHSLRHVLRLMAYRAAPVTDATPKRHPLRVFYLRALPFTLLSIVMLVPLGLIANPSARSLDWLALYMVLISALTVPHLLVVEWMDRREQRAGTATPRASPRC